MNCNRGLSPIFLDNIVVNKLRSNRPLTKKGLEQLEAMLVKIGEEDGKTFGLHAGSPEALFTGKDNVVEGIFDAIREMQPPDEQADAG